MGSLLTPYACTHRTHKHMHECTCTVTLAWAAQVTGAGLGCAQVPCCPCMARSDLASELGGPGRLRHLSGQSS